MIINKLTFVTLGYAIFAWLYYKLTKKWIKKANDKYWMVLRAYVGTMLALPTGLIVIYGLGALFSLILGGMR